MRLVIGEWAPLHHSKVLFRISKYDRCDQRQSFAISLTGWKFWVKSRIIVSVIIQTLRLYNSYLTPQLSFTSAKACKLKQFYSHVHSYPYYSFIHSFIHVTISSKTAKLIHYFSKTVGMRQSIYYFNSVFHNLTLPLNYSTPSTDNKIFRKSVPSIETHDQNS